MSNFSSSRYWERRYEAGGTSGAGSMGRLARFKASFINAFVEENKIVSVIDFGCGDSQQLALLSFSQYTGVDVSQIALNNCREKFSERGFQFVTYSELADVKMAELAMSIDVVFNLVEDSIYEKYVRDVFTFATDYVIFYSSNYESKGTAEHVRHRCVTKHIGRHFPEWSLVAHVPNIYPYEAAHPEATSFADFLVYGRMNRECRLTVPAKD